MASGDYPNHLIHLLLIACNGKLYKLLMINWMVVSTGLYLIADCVDVVVVGYLYFVEIEFVKDCDDES